MYRIDSIFLLFFSTHCIIRTSLPLRNEFLKGNLYFLQSYCNQVYLLFFEEFLNSTQHILYIYIFIYLPNHLSIQNQAKSNNTAYHQKSSLPNHKLVNIPRATRLIACVSWTNQIANYKHVNHLTTLGSMWLPIETTPT